MNNISEQVYRLGYNAWLKGLQSGDSVSYLRLENPDDVTSAWIHSVNTEHGVIRLSDQLMFSLNTGYEIERSTRYMLIPSQSTLDW